MSFPNQGFWMAKGSNGCLNDGEMAYDNSRIEPKRSHQWFMDGPEVELFPNKKQAVEVPNNNLFSAMLNSNVSPWGGGPSFHSFSGHFTERLFDSETARTMNFDERNISSVDAEKMNLGRKVNENPFGNDSSFGLSMSHTLEDPGSGLAYGGFRKVKVSEVKDSENLISVSMGHPYNSNDNTMSTSHAYNKADDNSISMGLTYNKGDDNFISVGDTYDRADNNFISMGQPFNKADESISIGQTFKENNSTMSAVQTFSKGDNSVISVGQTYNKIGDNAISTGQIYSKGQESTVSIGQAYNKSDNNILSIGHSYNKGESTIISFGGCDDDDDTNTSGRLLSNYELLMGQTSVKKSEVNEREFVNSNIDTLVNISHITASGSETVSKKKDDQKMSKKVPPNNFPSNVRSLLSTGMLDGVPVKYTAWSREELRGVIKGSGYLCGCQSCNFSKVINAYEFERHAGCKTKHPNNHIYFENGKTIYGIVQELRSTPQNMLFEVIQTITGSPINQKSFRLWKESFLAATRELQRIYGKDEGKQLS
ncbi:uncharacterized protein LOC107432788 isoform X2 [Ziziphus jujuba]|uniref:Uncharacterized protein LOC107432788 isoform X2 n=1 Tax=Ziziphus jujuba TaxID=326968 RepID=A0A6P6FLW0_ZIZJJ|nr:uncharacterized protein LOC107432788 isoform X2 [Ziziphus jujuba]